MTIKVRVVPRAKKQRIEVFGEGLKIYLVEPAREGKANRKLIELLAEYYNIKRRSISIVQGLRQKDKVIQIRETH